MHVDTKQKVVEQKVEQNAMCGETSSNKTVQCHKRTKSRVQCVVET